MIVSRKIIGHNIRSARIAAHLTQERAAEKVGICLLHFGRIERGEREPSIKMLTQIASVLHTSLYTLLRGCILDKENHPVIYQSSDPKMYEYGEYALALLDEYRVQIQKYYDELKLNESTASS